MTAPAAHRQGRPGTMALALRALGLALWLGAALCLVWSVAWFLGLAALPGQAPGAVPAAVPGAALPAVLAVLAVALLAGHLPFMAVEMAWMRLASRGDPVPPARRSELLRALGAEVLAAPRAFLGRMAWRSQRWPDRLGPQAAGRTGVLLVHGFVCNRGLWNPWLERLTRDGTPFVAVNLEPVFAPIDAHAGTLEAAARRLQAATGRPPVVVAHSMGGLAVRAWLQGQAHGRVHQSLHQSVDPSALQPGPQVVHQAARPRVRHVLTIGSPHHGTALAAWAFSPNTRQMRRSSPWLQALAAREAAAAPAGAAYAGFTCLHGNCDNVVFPPSTATLPGADNRLLRGAAHVHMVERPEAWAALQDMLAAGEDRDAAPRLP